MLHFDTSEEALREIDIPVCSDFFGFKTQLDRKNFVPYEDIIDLNPTYLSASTYLQTSNPYDAKIYPKYSGSHYTSPYQLNGIIELLRNKCQGFSIKPLINGNKEAQ